MTHGWYATPRVVRDPPLVVRDPPLVARDLCTVRDSWTALGPPLHGTGRRTARSSCSFLDAHGRRPLHAEACGQGRPEPYIQGIRRPDALQQGGSPCDWQCTILEPRSDFDSNARVRDLACRASDAAGYPAAGTVEALPAGR